MASRLHRGSLSLSLSLALNGARSLSLVVVKIPYLPKTSNYEEEERERNYSPNDDYDDRRRGLRRGSDGTGHRGQVKARPARPGADRMRRSSSNPAGSTLHSLSPSAADRGGGACTH